MWRRSLKYGCRYRVSGVLVVSELYWFETVGRGERTNSVTHKDVVLCYKKHPKVSGVERVGQTGRVERL